jgi:hypothetical protein
MVAEEELGESPGAGVLIPPAIADCSCAMVCRKSPVPEMRQKYGPREI